MQARKRNIQALVVPAWRTIPAVLIVMPALAYAQTEVSAGSPAASAAAGQGAARTSQAPQHPAATGPRITPTAGLGGTRHPGPSNPGTIQTGVSSGWQGAFGGGGLYYSPGFRGCASVGNRGSRLAGNTLLQPLQQPAGPARSRGRNVQLSVSGAEIYTDNFKRQEDGESDFITVVAPRLDACQSSGRIRGELTYRLSGVVYANHSDKNDVYNEVRANTTVSVLPSHLYFDASTRYGQTVADPNVGYSGSNAIAPGNQTTEWTFNLSPYAVQSLGPLGRALLRYRYGENRYPDSDLSGSRIQAIYFNLTSPRREIWSWRLNVTSKKITRIGDENDFSRRRGRQGDDTQHFDKAVAQVGLQATETLKLIARGGVEDDYSGGDNDRFSSPFWSVGFNWAEGRNSISGRYGHRFFGASYYLQAAHRAANWTSSLSYREKASSPALNALNGGNFNGFSRGFAGSANRRFGRGIYVEKRWQAALTYRTALTRTRVRGFYRTRDYQTAGIDTVHDVGASILTRYEFAPRTALIPRFNWYRRDAGGNGGDYDNYEAGISMVHALGPHFRVGVSYLHAWRESSVGGGYTENRLALQIFKGF